ncbi:MAG: hypothetical protein ABIO39_09295 [Caulobacteraceae bacterium]
MDSRLGRIDMIRWQARGRVRRRMGPRLSTVILGLIAVVGALLAWAEHAGGLHLGKEAEFAALLLILPWGGERIFALVRSSLSWVTQ